MILYSYIAKTTADGSTLNTIYCIRQRQLHTTLISMHYTFRNEEPSTIKYNINNVNITDILGKENTVFLQVA
jgi:hypothetical protein